MVNGAGGSRWRARMFSTTSAECTPWLSASAQAASTTPRPSLSTAVRMSTICRSPSVAAASLRRTRPIAPGQLPVLERRAVTQCPRLARQHRHIVPGIVDRLAAPEAATVLAEQAAVLAQFDPLGISADLHRAANGAGGDGVFVVVEPHQAGA